MAEVTTQSTTETQLAYLYCLSHVIGLSDRSALKFKNSFPTLESWERLPPSERAEAASKSIGSDSDKVIRGNFDALMGRAVEALKSHQRKEIHVVSIEHEEYPYLLKQIPDPPLVLFVKGSLDPLRKNKNVAVVGTRDATPSGEEVAFNFSKWLGEQGWCVVSGLAKGIDTAAHRGTLEAHSRTIAVMATPLDKIYPAENRQLANDIIKFGGCWVSEIPLWQKFNKGSFVQRDRIQSGMSVAVVPVQTDVEGGTMHTVNYAEKQNRLLLCPKPVETEKWKRQYAGIRMLIQTKRARAFSWQHYEEILQDLFKCRQTLLKDWKELEAVATVDHHDAGIDGQMILSDGISVVFQAKTTTPLQEQTVEDVQAKSPRRKRQKRTQVELPFLADSHQRPTRRTKKNQQEKEEEIRLRAYQDLRNEIDERQRQTGQTLFSVSDIMEWLEEKMRWIRSSS